MKEGRKEINISVLVQLEERNHTVILTKKGLIWRITIITGDLSNEKLKSKKENLKAVEIDTRTELQHWKKRPCPGRDPNLPGEGRVLDHRIAEKSLWCHTGRDFEKDALQLPEICPLACPGGASPVAFWYNRTDASARESCGHRILLPTVHLQGPDFGKTTHMAWTGAGESWRSSALGWASVCRAGGQTTCACCRRLPGSTLESESGPFSLCCL